MVRGNSFGLAGPGLYYVYVPPGIRTLTVTPSWTNTQITGVAAQAFDYTYQKNTTAPSNWGASDSGTGKALRLERGTTPVSWGPGATMLTLTLSGGTAVNGSRYRFLAQHNFAWKSANDRLEQLELGK